MPLLHKCPTCAGELVDKRVEELVKGGVNFAEVTVPAEVCLRCGLRLFDPDTVRLLERIAKQLSAQEVEDFEPMGRSFRVLV
ncbi:MAG: YgiT-type zinc finger protein [Dehalococcoidia bacterium]|nr:YgiT-type zinc finger protein [Dehalococcoidia bacterium]